MSDRQPQAKRRWFENVSGTLAVVAAIGALAVSAVQTHLLQAQVRASAWPYLTIAESINLDEIHHETSGKVEYKGNYSIRIGNDGVGPARIRAMEVRVDGQARRNWTEALQSLLGRQPGQLNRNSVNNEVLPASLNRETAIDAISTTDGEAAHALSLARERIGIEICYCSIYDECWIARWGKHEKTEVSRCKAHALEFEG